MYNTSRAPDDLFFCKQNKFKMKDSFEHQFGTIMYKSSSNIGTKISCPANGNEKMEKSFNINKLFGLCLLAVFVC